MSLLTNPPSVKLSAFRGAQDLYDDDDVSAEYAREAINTTFPPDGFDTRRGFATYFTPASPVSTGYHFNHLNVDYFVYLTVGRDVILRNLSTSAETTLQSGIGTPGTVYKAQFLYTSGRLYWAIVDRYNLGIQQARVWTGVIPPSSADVYTCFHAPITTAQVTVTVTETGTGVISKGRHKVALRIVTKDGFITRPGPVDGSQVLVPTVITATGGKQLRVQAAPTGTWPAWVDSIQVIMTTVNQSERYETITGTMVEGLGGTATVYDKTFNFSDAELRAIDSSSEDILDVLIQDAAGAGPFSPKGIVQFGDRVVWIANYGGQDCFFPSERFSPQFITANEHLRILPGQPSIGTMLVQGEVLYGLSNTGIWGFTDSGGIPVTWGTPAEITGAVGVSHLTHAVQRRGPGPAFFVNPSGLHMLSGGEIAEKPLNYYQTNAWATINWADLRDIQILDNYPGRNLIVIANRHVGGQIIMVWDYSRGLSLDKINYCYYAFAIPGFTAKWAGIIHSPTSNIWELLISGDSVLRQKSPEAGDLLIYQDSTYPIQTVYETAKLPNGSNPYPFNWSALAYRAKGIGTVTVTAKSYDDARNTAISNRTLSMVPGKLLVDLFDMQTEKVSFRIINGGAAGDRIRVSHVEAFYHPWVDQR